MSLVRLLTAGRSLVGGSNWESHYRMSTPGALPKFGSAKNPFRSRVSPVKVPAETGRAVVAAVPAVASPVAAPAPQQSAAAVPARVRAAAAPGRVRRGWNWLRDQNARAFNWLAHPRPAVAKPAVPRFDKLPIQGELSLDRITVVRNDLSDADLEIVSRMPVAPTVAPAAPALKPEPMLVPMAEPAVSATAPKVGAARMAWNRAGRLLGAMKT